MQLEYYKDKTKIKEAKKVLQDVLNAVRKKLKNDKNHKITFSDVLTGSGKRKLILIPEKVENQSKREFDIDCEIMIQKNDNKNGTELWDIFEKEFITSFWQFGFQIEKSGSKTIKFYGSDKSYWFEMMLFKKNSVGDFCYISNSSKEHLSQYENNYSNFLKEFKSIKGPEEWGAFRILYREKRNENDKKGIKEKESSFKVLINAVHEFTQNKAKYIEEFKK